MRRMYVVGATDESRATIAEHFSERGWQVESISSAIELALTLGRDVRQGQPPELIVMEELVYIHGEFARPKGHELCLLARMLCRDVKMVHWSPSEFGQREQQIARGVSVLSLGGIDSGDVIGLVEQLMGRPVRTLIVDKDLFVRQSIEGMCDKLGWKAQVASSATEALRLCLQEPSPDLLITELMLNHEEGPERDLEGLALIRSVRQMRPDTKVVVITNRAETTTLDDARASADLLFEKVRVIPEDLASQLLALMDPTKGSND